MQFDSADVAAMIADNSLGQVILHEMAHVIGVGTLWTHNGLYVNGTGRYTGVAALAAYQNEFNPLATFVPIELGGGPGTHNAHWNEADGGGVNTNIVSTLTGLDLRHELLTGWLDAPTFISSVTRASFVDLGYTVAIPEPASFTLCAFAFAVLLRRRST